MKQKPAFVLDVRLPPGSFDVNVTPDKREIFMTDVSRGLVRVETFPTKIVCCSIQSRYLACSFCLSALVMSSVSTSALFYQLIPCASHPMEVTPRGFLFSRACWLSHNCSSPCNYVWYSATLNYSNRLGDASEV